MQWQWWRRQWRQGEDGHDCINGHEMTRTRMMVMVRVTIKKHLPCKLEDNNETSVNVTRATGRAWGQGKVKGGGNDSEGKVLVHVPINLSTCQYVNYCQWKTGTVDSHITHILWKGILSNKAYLFVFPKFVCREIEGIRYISLIGA